MTGRCLFYHSHEPIHELTVLRTVELQVRSIFEDLQVEAARVREGRATLGPWQDALHMEIGHDEAVRD